MRILVIGGTRFVGRHIVEAALADGCDVTLLNRGISGADLFAHAEWLGADRDAPNGLAVLEGRSFDHVIDTCAYHPGQVAALEPYAENFGRYTLVSTISVYREPLVPGIDESAPLRRFAGAVPGAIGSADDYGGLKVLCEEAAERLWPGRTLTVRPGLVAGPHDPTDRFTYWPRRVARGGAMVVPDPSQPVQLIDARDLGAFVVDAGARGLSGVFNALGPPGVTTFADMIDACRRAAGVASTPVWVGDDHLLRHGVEPWQDLPLWLSPADRAFCQIDNRAALAAGLRLRPLVDTARDTLDWDQTRPAADRVDALSRAREAELLGSYAETDVTNRGDG